MNDSLGYFCMVLHTHIPYVLGHGTWPHGSEMLYEAVAGCYLRLLDCLNALLSQGIRARITMSITPVVMEQLSDERFKGWFSANLEHRIATAAYNREEFEWRNEPHLAVLAQRWQEHFIALRDAFHQRYFADIIGSFRYLQEQGAIELMTSAGTHGYLPLLREEGSVHAQIKVGVHTYRRHFGRQPHGFWLPECAYRPQCMWDVPSEIGPTGSPWFRKGLEQWLALNGIEYFIVDSHSFGDGHPIAVDVERADPSRDGPLWRAIHRRQVGDETAWRRNPHYAYFVGDHFEDYPPIAVLARDSQVSFQVWSGEWGYPGDEWYLDFHKKHFPGGLRYWRVTQAHGDLGSKQPYEPDRAEERARVHAGHFLWVVKETLRHQSRAFGRKPMVCVAFDAELFGHWWFEGPQFLHQLLEWMHADPEVEVVTVREYLERDTPTSAITLPEASWGAGGGHYVWLNQDTIWTWQRIYDAELDMRALVHECGETQDPVLRAMIQQAGRELLLMQSSDWQFLITTHTARPYAESRLHCHHSDFKFVANLARRYNRGEWISDDDWRYYGHICDRDRLFPDLDINWFKV